MNDSLPFSPATIANTFVQARQQGIAVADYPGARFPTNLAEGYACQDEAIALAKADIGGWKVGQIPRHLREQYGCDRLAGPIFQNNIAEQNEASIPTMGIYPGGFAAMEAEFVAVIAVDVPLQEAYSLEEVGNFIGQLRGGIEIAGSPFAAINEHGPAVTVSDFGNNAGLVVGPVIENWQALDADALLSQSFVDGELAGSGGATGLDGGILRSVQFLLENTASRGIPVKAGCCIATGQTTGIHVISSGQEARAVFQPFGEVHCRIG